MQCLQVPTCPLCAVSLCAQTDAGLFTGWPCERVHLLIQVLQLEHRVLELELEAHRARAIPEAGDQRPRQAPAQELGQEARGQGRSDHCRVQVTTSQRRVCLGGLGGSHANPQALGSSDQLSAQAEPEDQQQPPSPG